MSSITASAWLTWGFVCLQKRKETGSIENLQKDLVGEADRLDIKDKAVLILCELLLGENILQEVKTHRLLFLRVSSLPNSVYF